MENVYRRSLNCILLLVAFLFDMLCYISSEKWRTKRLELTCLWTRTMKQKVCWDLILSTKSWWSPICQSSNQPNIVMVQQFSTQ